MNFPQDSSNKKPQELPLLQGGYSSPGAPQKKPMPLSTQGVLWGIGGLVVGNLGGNLVGAFFGFRAAQKGRAQGEACGWALGLALANLVIGILWALRLLISFVLKVSVGLVAGFITVVAVATFAFVLFFFAKLLGHALKKRDPAKTSEGKSSPESPQGRPYSGPLLKLRPENSIQDLPPGHWRGGHASFPRDPWQSPPEN